jgi:CheY-like chemotaxis protein
MSPESNSVLLIDDNATVRIALRSMFEGAGFVCFECEDAPQALRRAKQLQPDLILLDFSMPRMNGIEAAPLLKKLLPQTPIVMFTMFATETFTQVALAAGVTEVVSKERGNLIMARVQSILHPQEPLPAR